MVQLGKFGAFPAHQLLGLHYDITYEITPSSSSTSSSPPATPPAADPTPSGPVFGQLKGKKRKKEKGKGKDDNPEGGRTNPGWRNILRPLKRQPLVDAVIGGVTVFSSIMLNPWDLDDITETNEFIEDSEAAKAALLSQDEIAELRAQGVTAEELIQRQMERHERFGLKTNFSKEKWRKRKEKKSILPSSSTSG